MKYQQLKDSVRAVGAQVYQSNLPDVSWNGPSGCGSIDLEEESRLHLDFEKTMIVTDKVVIIGGLCIDASPESPADMDGEGSIHRYSSRGKSRQTFLSALGYDSYGEPQLDHSGVQAILIKNAMEEIWKDIPLRLYLSQMVRKSQHRCMGQQVQSRLRVEALLQFALEQEGAEQVMNYLADVLWGARMFHDLPDAIQDRLFDMKAHFELDAQRKAWEQARELGLVGDSMAVQLDVYQHGGIIFSLMGHGTQCRWDTSKGESVWVPDACARENISDLAQQEGEWALMSDAQRARAISTATETYAKSCLDVWNQYCNGEVYGVCIYVIDRETGERIDDQDDECWGYYGTQNASEELYIGMQNALTSQQTQMASA